MALTFTTGMTEISDADSVTNWAAYKITAGGGTPSAVLDTDLYKEGIGCIGIVPTSAKDCGMVFDYYAANGNTVLNLSTTGNEVLGVWILILSKAMLNTIANGGAYIIVTAVDAVPSTTNKWAKWWIMGSDEFHEGWNFFLVDTRKTPSATNGGWVSGDLATTYRIGIGVNCISSWKAEWLYCDWMCYGRPIYTLTGDGSTVADWADFLSDSETLVNGLIEDINGAYSVSCGIQFGDDAQTATTTFTDATGQCVNFKRYLYYYSTGLTDALNYGDYYIVSAEGAASYGTSITLGSLVGTNEGILGGVFRSLSPANVSVKVDFNTDQAHITTLDFHCVTFSGIRGTIDLGNNSAFNYFSCTFIDCSQVNPNGNPEMRNCFFIDTADVDSALLWNENIDIRASKFISNTTGAAIEHPSAVGTPYSYYGLSFSGNTYDVLNSSGSAITINYDANCSPAPSSYEGSTVTFQTSVTLTIRKVKSGNEPTEYARVAIYRKSDMLEILNADADVADDQNPTYYKKSTTWTQTGIVIIIRARETGYLPFEVELTIPAGGLDLTAVWIEDPNFN